MAWDLVLLVLVLYVCFELPVELAFEGDTPGGITAFNYVIDVLFALDIVINFRTALVNRWGEVSYNSKEIAHKYIHGTCGLLCERVLGRSASP